MQVTNPIPIQFPSTYTLNLSSSPRTLFVLKIIISNPSVNQTITFYNQNGSIEGQPIVLTNSVEIKLRYVNFSKITFSDTNVYNIFASVQTMQFNTEENLSLYMSDSDFSVVPINNADIIKPLDANGYVEVDDVLFNAKIKALNQDASGNVGMNIENSIPSGANEIGIVGITGTITPNALTNSSLVGNTNAIASTKSQIVVASTIVHHFQFINTGSATITLGDSVNQAIPVASGGVFIWDGSNETTDLSQWFTFSATASVAYVVVYQ